MDAENVPTAGPAPGAFIAAKRLTRTLPVVGLETFAAAVGEYGVAGGGAYDCVALGAAAAAKRRA